MSLRARSLATRKARAGTPIAIIQAQLGHASPVLTLSIYGRFLPSAADREAWEAKATAADDQARRDAETT